MQELKNELKYFEGEEYDENHKTKAIEALKRMEKWNLFSHTSEVMCLIMLYFTSCDASRKSVLFSSIDNNFTVGYIMAICRT